MFSACTKENELINRQKKSEITTTNALLVTEVLQDINPNVIIGAAVNSNKFGTTAYKNLATLHYNSLSAENDMKMNSLNPSKFTWDFGIIGNGMEEENEKIPIWLKIMAQSGFTDMC